MAIAEAPNLPESLTESNPAPSRRERRKLEMRGRILDTARELFTEQGFGPAFGRVLMTAVDLLVEAGYPPEAVLLELYLSGEFAYSLEKIREVGMTRQTDFHSRTSKYGLVTRAARYFDLDSPLRPPQDLGVV